MEFCEHCNNLLLPDIKSDEPENWVYKCRVCGHTVPVEDSTVTTHRLMEPEGDTDAGLREKLVQGIVSCPYYTRHKSVCKNCSFHTMVLFQDKWGRYAEAMRFLDVCPRCSNVQHVDVETGE
ncbi:hypothetical protein KIPB_003241 [Kipferlia bialata]|uniref:DNA-directed RNA polymerase II subunit RPB9-like zinc ribbon domain-containing protein n=1 Tax=Kipferlia bialata TaxID=797122 RepID=A0A9K3GH23_9EUKA|nr:hypothetical protein KIPB_003241 [Kipferlia bialata]|eukprot:g3241.t1